MVERVHYLSHIHYIQALRTATYIYTYVYYIYIHILYIYIYIYIYINIICQIRIKNSKKHFCKAVIFRILRIFNGRINKGLTTFMNLHKRSIY